MTKSAKWVGIAMILMVGLIHFVDAPDSFSEATYKGLMFTANGVGAFVAAVGIYLNRRGLGWNLGAFVAAGAFVGYVISRTAGLPGLGVDEWLEPVGLLPLAAEALFISVYLRTFSTARSVVPAEGRAG